MSKTRRVQAQDKYITRTECHALIVHVINQVFAQMAEPPTTEPPVTEPYVDAGEGAE